jgi:uncharacterized RDD family membrane protein YckC
MPDAPPAVAPPAGLGRRCLSLLYETLFLCALLFFTAFVYTAFFGQPDGPWGSASLQLLLLLVMGVYFLVQWLHGGQTLAMKTWRLRLVTSDGRPLGWRQALLRYLVACLLLGLGGVIWAVFDRQRLFLQDRLAGTRVVRTG